MAGWKNYCSLLKQSYRGIKMKNRHKWLAFRSPDRKITYNLPAADGC
ncbi:MAG: hypothetical protein L0229_18245 [Blastocatellia bacterium]|nr:hypothetical protein [Blastocatellia bacterium]